MLESELYLPLKNFLQSQNYEVKSEINGCDVVALRGDEEPVIIELKLNLNLAVLLQAVDRQALAAKVYIGVPASTKILKTKRRHISKLLRMLRLGLILINPDLNAGSVDVLFDPGEYKPRKSKHRKDRLLREFVSRVGDPNIGGSDSRKGLITAYRQRSIAIARF